MVNELKNRVVITGANRGIGRACLNYYAEREAEIFGVVRNVDKMEEIREILEEEYGCIIHTIYADFENEDSVKQAAKEILGLTKNVSLDALINNIGIAYPNGMFNMTSMSQIRTSFEINFFSPILFTQLIAKKMIKSKKGSIVWITSSAAFDGGNNIEYSSSKAAIVGAVRRLAIEYGQYGIRVNGVAPGFTDTDMGNAQDSILFHLAMQNNIIKRMAEPAEIAEVVAFLASERAGYITGQIIKATGGI